MSNTQRELEKGPPPRYAGFVAGVFSGITKLAVGHPFDTVKVRLQTSNQFNGPIDCVKQTIGKEGIRGLYKGATPPLIGWMVMDSIMLGSLTNYRRLMKDHIYPNEKELPLIAKSISGVFAGWTVSFVASPIEHIKARLQIQYDATTKVYSGPLNCAYKLISEHGIAHGLYRGLPATMFFRTNFLFWWGSYDIFTKAFEKHIPSMPAPMVNFWAGGLGATIFWITAYPSDIVKQQIMTSDLSTRKSWWYYAKQIYNRSGWRGFFRGFGPSIVRSFPCNAAALASFEAVMRLMH